MKERDREWKTDGGRGREMKRDKERGREDKRGKREAVRVCGRGEEGRV